eukprot:scaffold33426_cov94-Skeletonema_dohrnii-CCMP3373.AAC.2
MKEREMMRHHQAKRQLKLAYSKPQRPSRRHGHSLSSYDIFAGNALIMEERFAFPSVVLFLCHLSARTSLININTTNVVDEERIIIHQPHITFHYQRYRRYVDSPTIYHAPATLLLSIDLLALTVYR